ncbi:hypothetical protein, variant [Aphanomyces invadans]|uniref:Fibronectin type-III domain-containing protein n=1 Tax=Aphanomyces invadans TaxID=157072 RepID=A0A024T8S3_9STRA|nr:hypothetical protein, variant [Aphanomyces invadans]ETV90384.1 hypothetical protein, variant [Aphanomyces invadans]|eukprot:XP_008880994.1 hypothetical protein, variant [Aphanomyces invadans]
MARRLRLLEVVVLTICVVMLHASWITTSTSSSRRLIISNDGGNVTSALHSLGRVIFPVDHSTSSNATNALSVNATSETLTFPPTMLPTAAPTTVKASTTTPVPTLNVNETHGVPGNPTDVVAVASDAQAQVSWKAPEDDGEDPITEYEVVCYVVDTNTPLPLAIQVTASGEQGSQVPTNALVPNLQNGVTYAFKVRAKNINGFSTWSAKSQPVSPLHPPDMCTSLSCSGNGACFPQYNPIQQPSPTSANASSELPSTAPPKDAGVCVCKPGFLAPDCSRVDESIVGVWEVSPWSACSNGCGGGTRTRRASCVHVKTGAPLDASSCASEAMPALSYICNGFACGSKLIEVSYEIEMFYDDVVFSAESERAFTVAFATEVASALQLPPSRLDVVSLRRGSIHVQMYLLPPTQAGEKSLNEVVADLQSQVNDKTSVLRTQEQHGAAEAEDISIGGLVGTIAVSVGFVAAFAYCLRKRHERLMKFKASKRMGSDSKMKPMGIRTMS